MAISARASLVAVWLLGGALLGLSQEPARKVRGLIFVSTRPEMVKRVNKEFRDGMPFAELVSRFDENEFIVEKWGVRSAIVVDRKLSVLASIEENAKLYDALGTALGPNLSVRIGDLPPEQRRLITDRIERSQPAYMRSQGFNLDDGAIGASFF